MDAPITPPLPQTPLNPSLKWQALLAAADSAGGPADPMPVVKRRADRSGHTHRAPPSLPPLRHGSTKHSAGARSPAALPILVERPSDGTGSALLGMLRREAARRLLASLRLRALRLAVVAGAAQQRTQAGSLLP
ncbi:hypothetical protein ABPG77_002921 [Micractinium sp. CCAP 211/92]